MQTVVGVFDSASEAESAREELLDAGFDDSAVRVQSQSSLQGDDYASTSSSTGGSTSGDSNEGFMAGIGHFFSNLFGGDDKEQAGHYSEAVRRGSTVVVVTVSDESRVEIARATLAAAGAVDIDKRTESWRQEGYEGFDPSARPFGNEEIQSERSRFQQPVKVQLDNGTVLPVVKEEIEVGKREVDLGAVRVFSRTEVRPVEEQIQLREEHADIERRPADRPATEADLKAFDGSTIEVREMAERPVVSKTARVVEEVVVGTTATTRTETISDQVRSTVVDVENAPAGTLAGQQGMPDYRSHYQANLASMGGTYEEYEPAYRYGSTLRSDPRYAGRAWEDVEMDAQRDWTSRNPGSTWERAKAATKHGWEAVTGRR
ncbi:MAG: hypothetical protein JWP96_1940 [Polaromonas sp.]|nr:hypothetical protein [Polaromonas sp.]